MIDSGLLFLGFSVYAWITILTVVSIFIVMSRSRIPAEVAFLGALTILLITGVVTEEEGMSGFGSELIGRSMTQCDFEQRNNVALIAVARQGRRIEGQPREIQLQAGDTLLLECPPKDEEQLERNNRRSLTFFDSHFVPQLAHAQRHHQLRIPHRQQHPHAHLRPRLLPFHRLCETGHLYAHCTAGHCIICRQYDLSIILKTTYNYEHYIQRREQRFRDVF